MIEVLLQHTSNQIENGGARQAQFEIAAVAMGEVALALEDCTVGAYYRVQGFLNRKSLKSVKSSPKPIEFTTPLAHIAPVITAESLSQV